MAPATTSPPGTLVLDPPALQRRAVELLAAVDEDGKRAAERVAAAEAHVRLVVLGAARDKELKLLDRAIDLDPYRADAYFLAALASHREGLFGAALERYEQAVALDPTNVSYRFHCGFGFLDAARRPWLADEDATELAEAAAEQLEAALDLDPSHKPAALGAIEAAIYGKATRLRDSITRVFSRVEPEEALRPAVTRLLYQAIFAFRVGKAKNVDQKNRKTMDEIAAVARRWLDVFRGDAALGGVIAAASAKCETAEEICEHVADHARAIPDVRVLRLLLRERLADVADPKQRLALFEGAMARIPALDGIAHDYLQMLHLVAKRAAAEGDVAAAREAWTRCLELDPDNPATTQNLLRLALHEGDRGRAAELTDKLLDLWGLYAELSPRADVVLSRAAARARLAMDEDFVRILDNLGQEKRPTAAAVLDIVRRWLRAQALARLAAEPSLPEQNGAALARALLTGDADAVHRAAMEVLALPVRQKAPVAYFLLGVPKDAADDVILKAREEWRERIVRELANAREAGVPAEPLERYIERASEVTQALVDPAARAAYDAGTCPTAQAEIYRHHTETYRQLVEVATAVEDDDHAARARLADLLASVPDPMRKPYLAVALKDEGWIAVSLRRVRFGGYLEKGWKLLADGAVAAALEIAFKRLADVEAAELSGTHRLRARAVLSDTSRDLWQAVETARGHIQAGLRAAHWSDNPQGIQELRMLAGTDPQHMVQTEAAERAFDLLGKDHSRDALHVLWSAYAGNRGRKISNERPAARIFLSLKPQGTGFYAFGVARALRENVISWYNAVHPTTYNELAWAKQSAMSVTHTAMGWAQYALEHIADDPLRSQVAQPIAQALSRLLGQLQNDARTLT